MHSAVIELEYWRELWWSDDGRTKKVEGRSRDQIVGKSKSSDTSDSGRRTGFLPATDCVGAGERQSQLFVLM